MKVLTGIGYTKSALTEISNNANSIEIVMNQQYKGYMWLGEPQRNTVTGEWGLVIDFVERERWLGFVAQEHLDKMIDVVDGDGWIEEG